MPDLALDWADDLQASSTGDFFTVSGVDELRQRIIRRFLSISVTYDLNGNVVSQPDYIFHVTYGGNARLYVDALRTQELMDTIRVRFIEQINQEPLVALNPPPQVTVAATTYGILVSATVALATTGQITAIPAVEIDTLRV